MHQYIDQLNRKVLLEKPPEKIISLVPSQTELLADLGMHNNLAGITKYCVYPPEVFLSTPHVGGTKNFSMEKVKILNPDFIIANKEENTRKLINELAGFFTVWVSDVKTLDDSLEMILEVGKITGTTTKANEIATSIINEFNLLMQKTKVENKKINTAYLVWRKPYMTAGGDTFINDMLNRCNFNNVFAMQKRYPEINAEQLKQHNPELILLSSEPYPFRQKHIEEFKNICPQARVMTVNGEFFSWYGSRLVMAPKYFSDVLDKLQIAE